MATTRPHDESLAQALTRLLESRQVSPRTRKTYTNWCRRFQRWCRAGEREVADPSSVRPFVEWLARERRVAPATQNQAASALAFLFREALGHSEPLDVPRARAGRRLPTVLSPEEVRQVLARLRGVHRLSGALMYGSGLRLSECLALRVKDISFSPPYITVRQGKGAKDRRSLLARFTKTALRRQIDRVRRIHEADLRSGSGWAPMPRALFRRSPRLARSIPWQYLFPASRSSVDPRSGRRGRRHLHPSSMQRAFRSAVDASGIAKQASCHTLRHSFATHALRMGYDIQVLKELLGHKDVKTTMIYLHLTDATALGLRSPLDALVEE